jgi:hypothetical protein
MSLPVHFALGVSNLTTLNGFVVLTFGSVAQQSGGQTGVADTFRVAMPTEDFKQTLKFLNDEMARQEKAQKSAKPAG